MGYAIQVKPLKHIKLLYIHGVSMIQLEDISNERKPYVLKKKKHPTCFRITSMALAQSNANEVALKYMGQMNWY